MRISNIILLLHGVINAEKTSAQVLEDLFAKNPAFANTYENYSELLATYDEYFAIQLRLGDLLDAYIHLKFRDAGTFISSTNPNWQDKCNQLKAYIQLLTLATGDDASLELVNQPEGREFLKALQCQFDSSDTIDPSSESLLKDLQEQLMPFKEKEELIDLWRKYMKGNSVTGNDVEDKDYNAYHAKANALMDSTLDDALTKYMTKLKDYHTLFHTRLTLLCNFANYPAMQTLKDPSTGALLTLSDQHYKLLLKLGKGNLRNLIIFILDPETSHPASLGATTHSFIDAKDEFIASMKLIIDSTQLTIPASIAASRQQISAMIHHKIGVTPSVEEVDTILIAFITLSNNKDRNAKKKYENIESRRHAVLMLQDENLKPYFEFFAHIEQTKSLRSFLENPTTLTVKYMKLDQNYSKIADIENTVTKAQAYILSQRPDQEIKRCTKEGYFGDSNVKTQYAYFMAGVTEEIAKNIKAVQQEQKAYQRKQGKQDETQPEVIKPSEPPMSKGRFGLIVACLLLVFIAGFLLYTPLAYILHQTNAATKNATAMLTLSDSSAPVQAL